MTVALPDQLCALTAASTADSPPARKIRTLIVDDQMIEREVMRRFLRDEPDIEIVGTSANGREAVEAIERLNPDLVFMDVQMPELDGFGVVSHLDPLHMPMVVFVTANEEFARKAFDVEALDYLMKPCKRERLSVALQRVRRHVEAKAAASRRQPEPKSVVVSAGRMAVKTSGRILLVRFSEIEWIEAADNYVKLHLSTDSHRLRETLSSIEMRLPASQFIRISRSAIVNIDCIRELQPMLHGEYAVLLQNGLRLTLTRNHRNKLRQLGI